MGDKSGGSTTTVQKADPWIEQQPYLKYGFEQAQNLYDSGGPQFYPNRTYVPFSKQTESALGMAENRAMGSGLERQLTGSLGRTMTGRFLNSNPYLDAMYGNAARNVTDSFTNAVMPGINATFGEAGRTGSGLHGETVADAAGNLSDSLSGMAANLYGTNYDQERQRMIQAAGLAPSASALDWNNISQMANVGRTVEGKAGEVLGDSVNRFNYYQNAPEQALARYISAIQGNYGMAGTTEQSGGGSNPLAGALGGGLLGYGIGSTAMPALASALGGMGLSSVLPGGLFLGGLGAILGGLYSDDN